MDKRHSDEFSFCVAVRQTAHDGCAEGEPVDLNFGEADWGRNKEDGKHLMTINEL